MVIRKRTNKETKTIKDIITKFLDKKNKSITAISANTKNQTAKFIISLFLILIDIKNIIPCF
jgi:hypothetical protein